MSKLLSFSLVVALLLGVAIFAYVAYQPQVATGSVSVTDEYQATTTAPSTIYGTTITGSQLIRTGRGSLGSIVITGANTGVINFYNATTSSVLLRTGQVASSTILLASIPASAAAGTYTFDVEYNTGLYFDVISGNAPTSTITYR